MTRQTARKYPLQLTISSLFITLTVFLGLILSWQSYNKISDIMLESANTLYERITDELILDFKATYGQISGGLRQFRLSPLIQASTFAERADYLASFQAVLESDASVYSVGIGYGNGDFLSAHKIDTEYKRKKYQAPAESSFIASYLKREESEPGFDAGKIYTIYYDEGLNEISRNNGVKTAFDPRARPWYLQATETPSATKPYVFYDSKIVGLTATSTTSEPGVVVMFDLTLDNLSQTLAKHQVTPSSEVVLINAEGQTFAYKNQEKVVIDATEVPNTGSVQLANLRQLGSGVLSYISTDIEAKEQDLDFEYNGERWIGSARIIARPGGIDLYALMLTPINELLAQANAIRWQQIITALLVIIIFIPVIWLTARRISRPLHLLSKEAKAISRFDFREIDEPQRSFIREVDELDSAMQLMKSTINKFITLINSLAGEQDLDDLLKITTRETMLVSQSNAALVYLMDERDDLLKASYFCNSESQNIDTAGLLDLTVADAQAILVDDIEHMTSRIITLDGSSHAKLLPVLDSLGTDELSVILLPLTNRSHEIVGLLCLLYRVTGTDAPDIDQHNIEFIEALSGFAAVTLESRQLLNMQEALLQSFIKLIAGAIDAKSPYTGGHCQRVPEITLMLAKAACDSNTEKFRDFNLDEQQWEELNIACWLHDCGKVTTPEYVVDKATKLETIYDRIHEVRMRFEVLKRDAEIDCWQKIADGGDRQNLIEELAQYCNKLDDDYAFVAECNVGGEFMSDEKIARLQRIAEKTWMRTLDDRLGLSWEELNRKENKDVALPVMEKLLADKPEHLIEREEIDKIPDNNPWGFKVETPQYKYNRGELHNLSVQRGTLSDEERYMINAHMIQTIIMLNSLPYPKYLRNVPLLAGSHHETMDGQGYPKRLHMNEQPLAARMMVIADIFEALTASDRPYKKSKTLSESIRILSFMRNDNHIDAELFELFLTSGVYLDYAKKFLAPEQIDDVNIDQYLA